MRSIWPRSETVQDRSTHRSHRARLHDAAADATLPAAAPPRSEGPRPGPSSATVRTSCSPTTADAIPTRERAHLQALPTRSPSISSRSSRRPRNLCSGDTLASMVSSRPACDDSSCVPVLPRTAGRRQRSPGAARCRRARSRQVIVDLPPHPFDLLPQRRRELVMPSSCGPLRLLREHRQPGLQSVR